jgi:hypothetical protein
MVAVSTIASTCSSSVTSTVTAVADPPPATISATADVGLVGDHVGHHHRGALGGEEDGGHPADAAARPGDHRNLAVESSHRCLPRLVRNLGPCGTSRQRLPTSVTAVRTLSGRRCGGGILTIMSSAGPRPLIGVSTYRQTTSWWSWERDAALVPGAYLDVVEAAGGRSAAHPARLAACRSG